MRFISDILSDIIGREGSLFKEEMEKYNSYLNEVISSSSFLVIGGAGSIGQATVKEIFKRSPKILHVVDINENNLVELVRDIRSSIGYIDGEFKTFVLDVNSVQYDAFIEHHGKYDYVLNFSALKHVRSEKDIFTLMRMIEVNIENTIKTLLHSVKNKAKKYFCMSTDKATAPENMMGASKRIMEMFVIRYSSQICTSMARCANVAFSDGSLLYGFTQRFQKKQPISVPKDIKRYFITDKEAGELCLLSCILGENRDIFFPKVSEKMGLIALVDILTKYLQSLGYEPYMCSSEEEAREKIQEFLLKKKWPCYLSNSDTTGEKEEEEFFTEKEILDMEKFKNIGIIKNELIFGDGKLEMFLKNLSTFKSSKKWTKTDLIELFKLLVPDFNHKETGKYLDDRM